MKILVVAGWMHPDAEGGSFRVVYEAGRRLAARGHEVHVATQRLHEQCPEHELLAGMHVHRYRTTAKSGPRFFVSTLREVRRLLNRLQRETGFDVVHTHHPVSAFAATRARGIRHLPFVAVLHSLSFLEHLDRRAYQRSRLPFLRGPAAMALMFVERAILNRSRRVVVLSDFTRSLLEKFLPASVAKVVKLPGGADLEQFRPEPSRAEARARLGLPAHKPIFFTCRRLEHRMGIGELIEAAALLRQQGRDALTLIAGRGSLEEALKRRLREWRGVRVSDAGRFRHGGADSTGLGEAVRLVGYVAEADLPLYYRAADCFVLPTRVLEGFGLVTAEAFACGTPVLGTPVGATPELIAPFDARLLTRDATPAGIAEGMARFLDEIAKEPDLERRCRAYAEERFSWEPFVVGLEQISRDVAG